MTPMHMVRAPHYHFTLPFYIPFATCHISLTRISQRTPRLSAVGSLSEKSMLTVVSMENIDPIKELIFCKISIENLFSLGKNYCSNFFFHRKEYFTLAPMPLSEGIEPLSFTDSLCLISATH